MRELQVFIYSRHVILELLMLIVILLCEMPTEGEGKKLEDYEGLGIRILEF